MDWAQHLATIAVTAAEKSAPFQKAQREAVIEALAGALRSLLHRWVALLAPEAKKEGDK